MFRNHFKIALRTLLKHKTYTLINVSGLAFGMACCLLIFMLVRHEWSFDRFHANADRIYRTYARQQLPAGHEGARPLTTSSHATSPSGEVRIRAMMAPDFTPLLTETFPAIEMATRVVAADQDFEVGDESFRQELMEADSTFFQIFSFPLLVGDPTLVLNDLNAMVVTAGLAETLFDLPPARAGEAVGRTVSITRGESTYDFTVSGVAADVPPNSSLTFDAVISFENYERLRLGGNDWGGRTSTYVLLPPDGDAAALEAAFPPFVRTQYAEFIEELRSSNLLAEGDDALSLHLQPLRELHLDPEIWVPYEQTPHNPLYSYILAGIGLLVLLIACINFMTLSVGRSTSRAREVGVRKTLGAHRGQLMKQFWGEALLVTAVAILLGFALTLLCLPAFNDLTGRTLSLSLFSPLEIAGVLLGLIAVVGLVAGGYPAAVLSAFRPAAVLKGSVRTRGNNAFTRSLVVVQYTISIGLIVCTVLMGQQLHYLMTRDLGYDQEQVLVIHSNQVAAEEAPRVIEHFRNRLTPYDPVVRVARAGYSFTRGSDRNTWTDAGGTTRSAYNFGVDYDYIDLMGMEIVEGRNFSRDFPGDPTGSVLVNEALVREFGMENPVGQQLTGWLDWIYEESPTIIGVVKDFNFRSLREEVQPAVMNMHPEYYNLMGAVLVKLQTPDLQEAVGLAEQTWNEVLPGKPFTYSFLDEDLAGQYVSDRRWSTIVTYSSVLAIVIACMGLFGLATLSVTRRTKEIGIRKVMGASVAGIVLLVSKEFIRLVAVAALLAWPLAYFGMARWLENFAFRIVIGPKAFLLAAVAAFAVAWLAVGYHAVRSARANPVRALRYE